MFDFEDELDLLQSFDQELTAAYQCKGRASVKTGAPTARLRQDSVGSNLQQQQQPLAAQTASHNDQFGSAGSPEIVPKRQRVLSTGVGTTVGREHWLAVADDQVDDAELSQLTLTENRLSSTGQSVSTAPVAPTQSGRNSGSAAAAAAGGGGGRNKENWPTVDRDCNDRTRKCSGQLSAALTTAGAVHTSPCSPRASTAAASRTADWLLGDQCAVASTWSPPGSRSQNHQQQQHRRQQQQSTLAAPAVSCQGGDDPAHSLADSVSEGGSGAVGGARGRGAAERGDRKFPGPAGTLSATGVGLAEFHEVALGRAEDDDALSDEFAAVLQSQSEFDDCRGGDATLAHCTVWRRALLELSAPPAAVAPPAEVAPQLLRRFNIGRLANLCARHRVLQVPLLVVAVRQLQPLSQLSYSALFVDHTGVMRGCVCSAAVAAGAVRVGSVLVLVRAAVWRASPRRVHYISVTTRSLALVAAPPAPSVSSLSSPPAAAAATVAAAAVAFGPDDVTVTKLFHVDCEALQEASVTSDQSTSTVLVTDDSPSVRSYRSSPTLSRAVGRNTGPVRLSDRAPLQKRARLTRGGYSNCWRGGAGASAAGGATAHAPPAVSVTVAKPVMGTSDLETIFADEADDVTLFDHI